MERDVWHIRLALLALVVVVGNGDLHFQPYTTRMSNRSCPHWSLYWDKEINGCAYCSFLEKGQRRIEQKKCKIPQLGNAIYREANSNSYYESLPRCNIAPLEAAGVNATCSFNVVKYNGRKEPTALPGALCTVQCDYGYIPVLDQATAIECASCTTMNETCKWNVSLPEVLCAPGPSMLSTTPSASPSTTPTAAASTTPPASLLLTVGLPLIAAALLLAAVGVVCCCRYKARRRRALLRRENLESEGTDGGHVDSDHSSREEEMRTQHHSLLAGQGQVTSGSPDDQTEDGDRQSSLGSDDTGYNSQAKAQIIVHNHEVHNHISHINQHHVHQHNQLHKNYTINVEGNVANLTIDPHPADNMIGCSLTVQPESVPITKGSVLSIEPATSCPATPPCDEEASISTLTPLPAIEEQGTDFPTSSEQESVDISNPYCDHYLEAVTHLDSAADGYIKGAEPAFRDGLVTGSPTYAVTADGTEAKTWISQPEADHKPSGTGASCDDSRAISTEGQLKQNVVSGVICSRGDSGISTANTDDLRSKVLHMVPDEIPSQEHMGQVDTQPIDIPHIPSEENLDAIHTSPSNSSITQTGSESCQRTCTSIVAEKQSPESTSDDTMSYAADSQSSDDSMPDSNPKQCFSSVHTKGVNELSHNALSAPKELDSADNMKLDIESINIDYRQHPVGNSDCLPAHEAGPRSLIGEPQPTRGLSEVLTLSESAEDYAFSDYQSDRPAASSQRYHATLSSSASLPECGRVQHRMARAASYESSPESCSSASTSSWIGADLRGPTDMEPLVQPLTSNPPQLLTENPPHDRVHERNEPLRNIGPRDNLPLHERPPHQPYGVPYSPPAPPHQTPLYYGPPLHGRLLYPAPSPHHTPLYYQVPPHQMPVYQAPPLHQAPQYQVPPLHKTAQPYPGPLAGPSPHPLQHDQPGPPTNYNDTFYYQHPAAEGCCSPPPAAGPLPAAGPGPLPGCPYGYCSQPPPQQQQQQQQLNPVQAAGDFILNVRKINTVVYERERSVDGPVDDVKLVIEETSRNPQAGRVQLTSDEINHFRSITRDKFNTNEQKN